MVMSGNHSEPLPPITLIGRRIVTDNGAGFRLLAGHGSMTSRGAGRLIITDAGFMTVAGIGRRIRRNEPGAAGGDRLWLLSIISPATFVGILCRIIAATIIIITIITRLILIVGGITQLLSTIRPWLLIPHQHRFCEEEIPILAY
jgi:hypothetical protein